MSSNTNVSKENNEQPLKIFLALFFPMFYFYGEKIEDLAQKEKVWTKARSSKFRNLAALMLSIISSLFFFLLSLRLVLAKEFVFGGCAYLLYVISQFPMANLFLLHKLNFISRKLSRGVLEPSKASAVKKARFLHSAKYAEIGYSRSSLKNGISSNVIGRRVEPIDCVLPTLGEPEVTDSELTSVLSSQDAIFPLNGISPDHHLVIGQTGSGKTTLITRMAKAALSEGWKVVIIDLKGDPNDVSKILNLESDQSKVRHFPTSSFNFWRGTPHEIAERMISFFPMDSEPYYLNRNSNAIHAMISRSDLLPPTSVEELIDRIRNGLKHSKTQSDINFFSTKDRGTPIGEIIANDLSIYLDPIRNIERNSMYRFHWHDDWNLALFTLDGFEPSSLKIADSLLHDFGSWIFSDQRSLKKSPILLIVDEASAFSALPRVPILSALIQRARSAQVSLVYASQNLSAFRDEKDNLLHSGAIRWLGSSSEVGEMIEATGTKSVVESGFQFDDQKYTGTVTHRSQKEFKIDPDFVRELPTFHWFVSARGKVSSIFVPPLDWH
jgi:ABC-type dipeptide/oligopeptide/nickel transport system ATPase subunit